MLSQMTLSERLRRYIADSGFDHNARLPPERVLCSTLGVSRGELRKALAELESDSLIWRQVGRGTFVGARPVHNLNDVEYLEKLARPIKVIEARLAIEPELARLSAIHGAKADFDEIRACSRKCQEARDWRSYEAWDNNFHLAIAKATHNYSKRLMWCVDRLSGANFGHRPCPRARIPVSASTIQSSPQFPRVTHPVPPLECANIWPLSATALSPRFPAFIRRARGLPVRRP
jgi:DNA-binding GntR family transcriptional regulator